jgi:hypothetical protein
MIQRMQTIYLFLAALTTAGYLYSPVVVFDSDTFSEFLRAWEMKYWIAGYYVYVIAIAAGISIGASLIAIGLFKFPTIQKLLSVLSIAGMLSCFFYVLAKWYFEEYRMDTIFYWGNIAPWVVIIFNALAIRGIAKDQDLLKSYDRLR